MTYTYEVIDTGELIEVEHTISTPAYTTYEINGKTVNVRRVINGGTGFILKGDCWAKDLYKK